MEAFTTHQRKSGATEPGFSPWYRSARIRQGQGPSRNIPEPEAMGPRAGPRYLEGERWPGNRMVQPTKSRHPMSAKGVKNS